MMLYISLVCNWNRTLTLISDTSLSWIHKQILKLVICRILVIPRRWELWNLSYWRHINNLKCLFLKPSCAFPVCHGTEERCRLVLSYVLEVSVSLIVMISVKLIFDTQAALVYRYLIVILNDTLMWSFFPLNVKWKLVFPSSFWLNVF